MLLTSIDPFVQEFERQFDRAVRQAAGQGGAGMPMDGIRRADDVVLRFDLPGVDPGSIEVTVDRGVLTVTARREEEFGEDEHLARWIRLAGEKVSFQGLPARICWLGYGQRHRAGLRRCRRGLAH